MKSVPYCASEIIDRVFAVASMVSEDAFIHKKVLAKVLTVLQENAEEESPAELTLACLRAAYQALGVKDPFENEKARQSRSMLGLESLFVEFLQQSPDRLGTCILLSLAASGDAIKGLGREDLERAISERLREPPAINDADALKAAAAKAKAVLFIASGAGELAADRYLLEELAKTAKVTVAVANRPVLARATAADAQAAGVASLAQVVDPGADMYGLIPGRASTAFNELFRAADLVISKGATNFQTLAGCEREVFHIFHCECPAVAASLGIPRDSGVIRRCVGTLSKEED
ncbi:MAG: DUF89 family protein [Planctomycetes bacterium]|nr:DUF89 family protein [Planctomycetota bacterium]